MDVAGILHTGLTVSHLEQSIAFCRDVLGLELVSQWDSAQPYLRTIVGFPDAELRIALVRLPGVAAPFGHHLELLEYGSPRGVRPDARTCNP
jgi:catechol 2,3-dioxygenase-like lactoylglutathione lyase family enzyme